MADDPKIVLDPPPAEPVDVAVTPDPPPAEPFDVPTFPDPGPGGTFDVPTFPDPGPRSPFDVATSPDSPPLDPFQVPTFPDLPPVDPFDVPTLPDSPPVDPFDVPTSPDLPPADPFDVATPFDSGPADPFDVPTDPDVPSPDPFDVPVTLDTPPADPFDVPIEYDPPPGVLIGGDTSGKPTIEKIIDAVQSFDAHLGNFLNKLVQVSPVSFGPGGGAMDPTVLAAWLRDYKQTVGAAGITKFINEQSALYAMNPVTARVFDPTYFLKMLIPGSMGHVRTTFDTEFGMTADAVALANDEQVKLRARLGAGLGGDVNLYSPGNTQMEGQELSVDEMVDAGVDGVPHPYMTDVRDQTGIPPVKRFDASKYFEERRSDGTQLVRAEVRARVGIENVQSREPALVASNFLNGVIRVPIGANEDPDGAVYSRTPNPRDLVDDDDTRVPLCFTDLRKDPVRNAYRSVYFRPLNLSFSNSVSPEWSEGSSFGRVDPIVGYQKTSRTYSVSFELHAFAPEDLEVMYRKMMWLQSMCYPSYDSDSLIRSGPVCRLRIGDAVATESGGLPGVIRSLSFDFGEALWELRKGMKVPRSFHTSVDFLALHEGPVGILNGAFGVFQLPAGPTPGRDTSNPGGPTESRDSTPQGATLLPGRFGRFGEPRRR